MGEDTREMTPAVDLETVTINPTLSSGSQLAHGCTLQASGVVKVTLLDPTLLVVLPGGMCPHIIWVPERQQTTTTVCSLSIEAVVPSKIVLT